MADITHTTKRNVLGRPCTYTDDIPQRMLDFFDRDPNEYIEHNFTTAGKSNYQVKPIPTLTGFCRSLGITNAAFHLWLNGTTQGVSDEQRRALLDAYSQAKKMQEDIVSHIGIMTNGQFAAFFLRCNADWRDNTEVKGQGETVKPVRIKVVSERPVEVELKDPAESVDWQDD